MGPWTTQQDLIIVVASSLFLLYLVPQDPVSFYVYLIKELLAQLTKRRIVSRPH